MSISSTLNNASIEGYLHKVMHGAAFWPAPWSVSGWRRAMSCPYLTEVTMSFCRAFPVKKLVPSDRVITDSPCDGEAYGACPVFREVTARESGAAGGLEEASHHAAPQGGRP